jgi:aryl-alcohol dehydrogenase-like predicted oxidoreductase
MQYNRLGKSGLNVSELCLGTMAFGRWIDEAASSEIIDIALDSGINFIDTANFYGKGQDEDFKYGTGESEEIIGRALKGRRDKVVLATKVGNPMGRGQNDYGYSRIHIMREVEHQLKRLQTDYIDYYQVHRFGTDTPLEETLRTLNDLVRQGKVRYIGCSNYAAWQIAKSNAICDKMNLEKYIAVQSQYNLLRREIENEIMPFCKSEEVGIMVYSPLGRGMLTGKYKMGSELPENSRGAHGEQLLKNYFTERDYKLVEEYAEIAKANDVTLPKLAMSWVVSHPQVSSAIIGASKPYHVTDAVEAIEWKAPDGLFETINSKSR